MFQALRLVQPNESETKTTILWYIGDEFKKLGDCNKAQEFLEDSLEMVSDKVGSASYKMAQYSLEELDKKKSDASFSSKNAIERRYQKRNKVSGLHINRPGRPAATICDTFKAGDLPVTLSNSLLRTGQIVPGLFSIRHLHAMPRVYVSK